MSLLFILKKPYLREKEEEEEARARHGRALTNFHARRVLMHVVRATFSREFFDDSDDIFVRSFVY